MFATANKVAVIFFSLSPFHKKNPTEAFFSFFFFKHDPAGYFTLRWSQVMDSDTVQPWMFRLWLRISFFSFSFSLFLLFLGNDVFLPNKTVTTSGSG